ncbi:MAG: thioredoxin family protein [Candidatus Omnitrophica bacterium]|nr:thioredoxin family protein [Candidatus Omnitrophota bacterium]
MRYPIIFLALSLPLFLGTTYIIKEGGVEVGRMEDKDGKTGVQEIDTGAKKRDPVVPRGAARARGTSAKKEVPADLFRPRTEWLEGRSGHEIAIQKLRESPGPFVIYFYTTWCPYCRSFEKKVLNTDEVESFLRSYVRVRLDGDQEKALMSYYGVTGYPTFIVISREGRKTRVRYDHTPEDFISLCRQAGLTD